jgi:hypothetical protein
MRDEGGEPVGAAPTDVQLHVRIAADGVDPTRLRALVLDGYRCSPIPGAVANALPVDLRIDIG